MAVLFLFVKDGYSAAKVRSFFGFSFVFRSFFCTFAPKFGKTGK